MLTNFRNPTNYNKKFGSLGCQICVSWTTQAFARISRWSFKNQFSLIEIGKTPPRNHRIGRGLYVAHNMTCDGGSVGRTPRTAAGCRSRSPWQGRVLINVSATVRCSGAGPRASVARAPACPPAWSWSFKMSGRMLIAGPIKQKGDFRWVSRTTLEIIKFINHQSPKTMELGG